MKPKEIWSFVRFPTTLFFWKSILFVQCINSDISKFYIRIKTCVILCSALESALFAVTSDYKPIFPQVVHLIYGDGLFC